jgi:hypothetical protein
MSANAEAELHAAPAAVDAAHERPYYDAEADGATRERYYVGVGSARRSPLAQGRPGGIGAHSGPWSNSGANL